jgi:hypothetical protein
LLLKSHINVPFFLARTAGLLGLPPALTLTLAAAASGALWPVSVTSA